MPDPLALRIQPSLTPEQLEKLTGFKVATICRGAHRGQIPGAIKRGGKWRFHAEKAKKHFALADAPSRSD